MYPTSTPMYLSRVVDVPSSASPALFDACWNARATAGGAPSWSLAVASASFRPSGPLVHGPARATAIGPFRHVPGLLRLGRLGLAVRVQAELAPWSSTRSELGLRYLGRHRLGTRLCDRYHRVGADLLDVLATELSSAALAARTDSKPPEELSA